MDQPKTTWLLEHMRCTSCRNADLGHSGESVSCRHCGRSYPIVDGAVNFLSDATNVAYRLEETDNISDHPFDGNARRLIDQAALVGGHVLDCGSGYKSETFDHVIQLEIVNYPNTDILAANQDLPFVDSSFDAVFSLDVLEHVNDPFASAAEIARVLKPGGYLYVDIPFLQAEHGYPNHYFNATREGLRRLFSPFAPLGHHVPASGHPIFSLWQITNVYASGLPTAYREEFLSMTLGKLLSIPELDWLGDPLCTSLDKDVQWLIASTTQALLQKDGEGPDPSPLEISAEDLPGFHQPQSVATGSEPRPAGRRAAGPTTIAIELSPRELQLIDVKRSVMLALRTMRVAARGLSRR
jgi:SAM-dependent methyltransferase